jgi:outer membrane receptor protein involved in Fe transport
MNRSKKRLSLPRRLAISLATLAFCAGVHAQARDFDIPAGELKGALDAFTTQSGAQVIYKSEDLRGLSTKGLKRSASPEEALQDLLEGTPLRVRSDAAGAMVIYLPPAGRSATENTQQLDTVVISATRRREPVRDIPMQVSVLDAAPLERAGAKGLTDYLTTEAGVDLSGSGPGRGSVAIRGISTGAQTIATVASYVDEVAVGSSSAYARGSALFLDMGLLDLNHIEVLRGPQGTLYGSSSMGGLIKYVTTVPETDKFSGSVSVSGSGTASGDPNGTVNAVLNVPIKQDVAALRISLFGDHAGGWIEGVGPAGGSDINSGNTTGARVSALVTPDNRWTIRLTATLQDIERDGQDFVDYGPTTGEPVYGPLTRQLSVAEPYYVKTQIYSADVEYDYGWARLNSITSWQETKSSNTLDATSVYVPLLAQFGINLDTVWIDSPVSTKRTTQEFRLTSKADKQFEWLAGVYLNWEDSTNKQYAESTNAGGGPGPQLAYFSIPSSYDEYALYGDATWKFGNGFALTGGVRVSHNKQDFQQISSGLLAGGDQTLTGTSSETVGTYLLTGTYAIDSASNVYGRVATGYRPGGPNAVPLDINTGQPLAPTTFESDSTINYELGYKANLLDNRLTINAAAFLIDWDNIQQPYAVNGVGVIVNAGKARSTGFEFSSSYKVDQWLLSGNLAYIYARFTEDAPGLGAHAGDALPNSARFTAALQATYNFKLMEYPAYAGVSYRYIGERDAGVPGSSTAPSFINPAYSLWDLQAGVDVKQFRVSLFARNLLNERAELSTSTTFIPLGGNALVSVAQPRTVGVLVNMAF